MTAVAQALFDGKYELIRLIGEGGMGSVHEAINARSGRRVAIKMMSPMIAKDPSAVERFTREARAATAIEHPNVVQVYDVGVGEGQIPYMVMELLQGESLASLIEREAPLAPGRLLQLMGPALGALAAAHARGIVHRDLKPENIFLARPPGTGIEIPKLLDFGISKVMNAGSDMSLTHTGTVLGTPYYMAPEQAAGKRTIDQRTDVYAIGVILFYALIGRLPFTADNYNALIVAILSEIPPLVSDIDPRIPVAVAHVVARAMAKDMNQRFQSVEELTGALVQAVGTSGAVTMSTASDLSFTQKAASTASTGGYSNSGINYTGGHQLVQPAPVPQGHPGATTGSQSAIVVPTNRLPLLIAGGLAVLALGGAVGTAVALWSMSSTSTVTVTPIAVPTVPVDPPIAAPQQPIAPQQPAVPDQVATAVAPAVADPPTTPMVAGTEPTPAGVDAPSDPGPSDPGPAAAAAPEPDSRTERSGSRSSGRRPAQEPVATARAEQPAQPPQQTAPPPERPPERERQTTTARGRRTGEMNLDDF